MRRITQRKQFRSDLKRQKRRGKDIEDLFAAVELLPTMAAFHRVSARTSSLASGKDSGSATSSRIGS